MGTTDRLHLRWNSFESNIKSGFSELRKDEEFFDVTLACGSKQIKAHKVILSTCSSFFRSLIRSIPHQHPLLYLRGIPFDQMESIICFIYNGEVNVSQNDLDGFLALAEELKIKGLTQYTSSTSARSPQLVSEVEEEEEGPPPPKRPCHVNKKRPACNINNERSEQKTSPPKIKEELNTEDLIMPSNEDFEDGNFYDEYEDQEYNSLHEQPPTGGSSSTSQMNDQSILSSSDINLAAEGEHFLYDEPSHSDAKEHPWPYLKELFEITRFLSAEKFQFTCMLCQDTLIVALRSRFNLKRHIKNKHPDYVRRFEFLVDNKNTHARRRPRKIRVTMDALDQQVRVTQLQDGGESVLPLDMP